MYGLNVKELLAKALKTNPSQILLMNDAACFLLREVFGVSAKKYHSVLGLTLGTDLGTSVFKDHNVFMPSYRIDLSKTELPRVIYAADGS